MATHQRSWNQPVLSIIMRVKFLAHGSLWWWC